MPISNKTENRFDKSDYNNSMRFIQVGNYQNLIFLIKMKGVKRFVRTDKS